MIAWISDTLRPLDFVKWIISAPTITPVPPIGIASVVWEGVGCVKSKKCDGESMVWGVMYEEGVWCEGVYIVCVDEGVAC